MANIQKITPFLWFEEGAEEAADFYVSVFQNSKIINTVLYPKSAEQGAGKPAGSVMTVEFEIEGMKFVALNGGPLKGFTFSPATSFVVNCETQEEIDHLWKSLSAVPEREQCGWCQDKFNMTWQIVPTILNEYLSDQDQAKVESVTKAFMRMKKFDIKGLENAYKGK